MSRRVGCVARLVAGNGRHRMQPRAHYVGSMTMTGAAIATGLAIMGTTKLVLSKPPEKMEESVQVEETKPTEIVKQTLDKETILLVIDELTKVTQDIFSQIGKWEMELKAPNINEEQLVDALVERYEKAIDEAYLAIFTKNQCTQEEIESAIATHAQADIQVIAHLNRLQHASIKPHTLPEDWTPDYVLDLVATALELVRSSIAEAQNDSIKLGNDTVNTDDKIMWEKAFTARANQQLQRKLPDIDANLLHFAIRTFSTQPTFIQKRMADTSQSDGGPHKQAKTTPRGSVSKPAPKVLRSAAIASKKPEGAAGNGQEKPLEPSTSQTNGTQLNGPNASAFPNAPDPNVRRNTLQALYMRYKQLHGNNGDDATLQRMAANLERDIYVRSHSNDEYMKHASNEIKRIDLSQQVFGTPPSQARNNATTPRPPPNNPNNYAAPSPGGMEQRQSNAYGPPNGLSYHEFCARMMYQPVEKLVDIMWSQRSIIYQLQQDICQYKKQLGSMQQMMMPMSGYPPSQYPPPQRSYYSPSPSSNAPTPTGGNYDPRPPMNTPRPQDAAAYWNRISEMKEQYNSPLKKAFQILSMASQSAGAMQSGKAESMKQNIQYTMTILNETPSTANMPRDYTVIPAIEAFLRESIIPLLRKVQEASQGKQNSTDANAPQQQQPPPPQQQGRLQQQQQQQPGRQPVPQQQQPGRQSLPPPQQQQGRQPQQHGRQLQQSRQLAPQRQPELQPAKPAASSRSEKAKENTQSNNMTDFGDFAGLGDLGDDIDGKQDEPRSSTSKKRPIAEV